LREDPEQLTALSESEGDEDSEAVLENPQLMTSALMKSL